MRKPVIAGNWKLHKTIPEALELIEALKKDLADKTDIDIVVAPVFTALAPTAQSLKGSPIALAAQNCYFENSGAFTGEVSPALLKDAGCSHVIVGHSERRQLFGETDELINHKIKAVLAEGLTPIFCIGETLEERESDAMMDVLKRQVTVGLNGLNEAQMLNVVVAYEPVWAIGTGKVASTDQAQEAHAFIRGLLAGLFSTSIAEQVRILYGGSVKPDNVDGLMAQTDIDGTLVGGASLKAADFIRIARFEKI
ncbi:triose-phosphate isomerase [Geoalkalibacter halelectricus]|uniref:Triosephosphate isomerase n=1 Tax=Geoalkalibacter halelectricus TaxID=2847045 RepID=A0ABY5ZN99_9BACT|nr:triose-phosphate isomerase [Geoalkalibacter halelectricus]MDO3379861.1 triose-phosphate isomerase [Geoalkalibacter halelectricus]UWZ80610.1 triose-phosphate isomerase [Geoalkalibacter halelectricus]